MDLDAVVDELYGLEPSAFTATRDGRARDARQAGEGDLAKQIKALRRPSSAAWAVNVLARHRSGDVARLIHLGEQMRAAQEALSGDQIRMLGRQRQQVVAGLARECRRLSRDLGAPISDAVEREIEQTLEAALADPAAAAAVSSGRLLRALSPAGIGDVDLGNSVAVPGGGSRPGGDGTRSSRRPAGRDDHPPAGGGEPRDSGEARREEAEEAEREAARAEDQSRLAGDRFAQAVEARRGANERAAAAEDALARLEAETAKARRAAEDARAAVRDLSEQEAQARAAADQTQRTADDARRRADALSRELDR